MFSIAEPGRVWQWTAELVMPPPYRPRPPAECDCRVPARLKIEQHLFWFVCCFEVNSRVRIRGLKVSGKLLLFWFFIEVSLWRLCHIKLSIKRCFSCFLDGLTLLTLHSSNIFSLHLARGGHKERCCFTSTADRRNGVISRWQLTLIPPGGRDQRAEETRPLILLCHSGYKITPIPDRRV